MPGDIGIEKINGMQNVYQKTITVQEPYIN